MDIIIDIDSPSQKIFCGKLFEGEVSSYFMEYRRSFMQLVISRSNSIGLGKGDDIFLDLTMDYNRRRSVRSELMSSAIKQIDGSISERLSLLVLTAAARCVHNVTPERRVELLEEVKFKELSQLITQFISQLDLEKIA